MVRAYLLSLLVLGGCSVDNPFFGLNRGDDDEVMSTGAEETSSGAPEAGTSETTEPQLPTSTSASSMTGETGETTESGVTATTGPVEPETSGTSTGTTSDETTSDETNTTGDDTTGEDTGDVVCPAYASTYQSLFSLCAANETTWTASDQQQSSVLKCGDANPGASVMAHENVELPMGVVVCDVFEVAPSVVMGGNVEGKLGGLKLDGEETLDAELYVNVVCKDDAIGCLMDISVWVQLGDAPTPLKKMSKPVFPFQGAEFVIPLHEIPGINQGNKFSVHLKATNGVFPSPTDRAYFIAPRIRRDL